MNFSVISAPDKFVYTFCLDSMTPKDEEVRRVKEEEFDSDANKFHGADKDDDGKLNKEEFPTFLDPEHHDMANHLAEVCVRMCTCPHR